MQHIKHSSLLKFIFFGVMLYGEMSGLSSCKKYLDKKQNTKVTTIDRVEDLQALLNTNAGINMERCGVYGECASDDYFSLDPSIGAGEKGFRIYAWQYYRLAFFDGFENDWESAYLPVSIANICIEGIEKFPKTAVNASQWDNVKGSALFIRAFYFFNLSCIYAKSYDSTTANEDLGIALKLGTDPYDPTIRATVAQSYEQIIKDAKASINYLPDIALHPLRPSKAAAYGLLARIYLSMREYDSAFKYADLSLTIRSELMDYNGDADMVNSIDGLNPPFRQFNKETVFYADMNTGAPNYVLTYGQIDTVLYSLYADNDLRKTAFFTQGVNGDQKFKGNYTQRIDIRFAGIATDEMFLTRAECYARKGMLQKSMDDLNALMIKRWRNNGTWVPFIAGDQEDALHKIWEERRKELVFRGLRWIDLKRFNKEGANIKLKRIVNGQTYELLPNSDKYALPIPEDIVQLTGVPQNPGWQ